MVLSNDLISQFVKTTKDDTSSKKENIVYGTTVEYGGVLYVRFDGSDLLTPVSSTTNVESGERVTVMIKNHSATITGSTSSPSASNKDVSGLGGSIVDLDDRLLRVEEIVAGEVQATSVTTDTLDASTARIDDLESMNVNIRNRLSVNEADVRNLKAANATIEETLTANEAEIDDLKAKNVSIDETLTANEADIRELKVEKLDAETAKITYANIDFSNIGKAAMEYFYSHSGLIENVVVGGATIAGKLVGVTISGDLVEANTLVADKLVIQGEDGLYYKLNTDGIKVEAEQTDYNSLNGQIIKAQSITASKIAVDDLVAFDATIGGFNITDRSLYSGVKESVNNTTRGIYLDSDGQIALGDDTNFLRYYKDQNGKYRLAISAESFVFTTGKTAVVSTSEEFYQSSSPITLADGAWSKTQPVWSEGMYIWRRSKTTYADGSTEYTPSETGICITGNTGAKGEKGEDSVLLMIESSNGNIFKNTGVATILTVNVIVGDQRITSYRQLQERFGVEAYLQWSFKRNGETEFTDLPFDDPRISDNGFILTLNPADVNVKTVFDCSLHY